MDPDSSQTKICRTCKKEKKLDRFPLSCNHRYCNRCLISAWDDQILVDKNPIIKCQKCEDLVEKDILKQILSDKTYKSYKELKVKKEARKEKNDEKLKMAKIKTNDEEIPKKGKKSDEYDRENEKKQKNEKKLMKTEEKSEESMPKEKKRKKSEDEEQEYDDDKKKRKKEKKRRKSEEEEEEKESKKIKKKASEEEDPEENYDKEKKEKRKEERKKKKEEEEIEETRGKSERNQEKNSSKHQKIDEKSAKKESKNQKIFEKDEKISEKPEKIKKNTDKPKEITEEPISENNCECDKLRKCFTLICGHLKCKYCLHKTIRKKLRKNELLFDCSSDEKKIRITSEMMEFIEIKEKYLENFQELTKNDGKNQENPNFFRELSDNSGFLENLSVRTISECSEIKLEKGGVINTFEKKSNFNDGNKEETKEAFIENSVKLNNKDLKCPVCFSVGKNTKSGNMIRCVSEKCQNKTIFCLHCREVLKISELKDHFEKGSLYLDCIKKVSTLKCRVCGENKSRKMECQKIMSCYSCGNYFCTECEQLIENKELIDHMVENCSKKQQEKPKGLKITEFYFIFKFQSFQKILKTNNTRKASQIIPKRISKISQSPFNILMRRTFLVHIVL